MSIKPNSSISELQDFVRGLEAELGFSSQTAVDKCLLLGEEVGELFKAVREAEGLPIEDSNEVRNVSLELADILIYLCTIANRYEIDLNRALISKHELNVERKWASKLIS